MNNISLSNAFHYTSYSSLACASICLIPAIEMSFQCILNTNELLKDISSDSDGVAGTNNTLTKLRIAKNALGVLFFSFCTTNIIPGTAVVGANMFLLYAYTNFKSDDIGPVTTCIGFGARVIKIAATQAIKKVCFAAFNLIKEVFKSTFRNLDKIGKVIVHVIKNTLNILLKIAKIAAKFILIIVKTAATVVIIGIKVPALGIAITIAGLALLILT